MTKWEKLTLKANECQEKAVYFHRRNEKDLAAFYYNAAEGFKTKAGNLTIAEAKEQALWKETRHTSEQ